jgi:hypothetical protein
MIRCILAVCAQQVIRDADTNTVSIISLIDEMQVLTLPAMLTSLDALFLLARDVNDSERPNLVLRVKLNDTAIHEFPLDADFQGKPRTRSFVRMGGLPVTGFGTLRIGVASAGAADFLGYWDIVVSTISPPVARVVNN